MTEILELPDRNFNAAIIKMLHKQLQKHLKQMKKKKSQQRNRKSLQRNRTYKEESN